jgi:cysteine desulfurase
MYWSLATLFLALSTLPPPCERFAKPRGDELHNRLMGAVRDRGAGQTTTPASERTATQAAGQETTRTYFDYAATSPLHPEVFDAMQPWFIRDFGNANTLYQEGKQARQALDKARATIATLIGASPTEIIFTSGGTESNNAVIAGVTQAIRGQKGREKGGNHVVSSAFEHHAVLEPIQALRREGYEIALVKPSRDGFITPEVFAAALRPDTLFASVMTAQNEIGTVQPVAELAECAHENGTLFHTDAVQALGKLAFDVREFKVDAASFSAHKIGGPQGVGVLYLKRQTPFVATQLGGGQESNRRSGTQNIAGAVGFAKALELVEKEREQEALRLAALRDHLATALLALDGRISLTVPLPPAPLPTSTPPPPSALSPDIPPFDTPSPPVTPSPGVRTATHLPNILSFLVAGFESETLILGLDGAGFAVSGGSACSTGSLDPSHVLKALGFSRNEAYGVLRISLGHDSTKEQADAFVSALAVTLRQGVGGTVVRGTGL